MALVGYSDSEDSDNETSLPQSKEVPKVTPAKPDPGFTKIIDRSNPHKLRVALPEIKSEIDGQAEPEDGPPAKRAKTGGGAFSGFNAFLPAPKRTQAAAGSSNGSTGLKRGPGRGVSLKTGAAPGFDRHADAEMVASANNETGVASESNGTADGLSSQGNGDTGHGSPAANQAADSATADQPVKKGNATMFRPLSVARNPKKKKAKPIIPSFEPGFLPSDSRSVEMKQASFKPRVSLFSLGGNSDNIPASSVPKGDYQSLVYEDASTAETEEEPSELPFDDYDAIPQQISPPAPEPAQPAQATQSLDSIAADLNLSEADRRQLFGRRGRGNHQSATNVVNFNTDQEYAANEALRAAGEQVQHNPVRAIAPGKHSLKQLVNAASNQKDALEEQFASGKRNKKEAGSKYGW